MRTLVECLSDPDWVKDNHDQAGFHAVQEIKRLEEQRDELADALHMVKECRETWDENGDVIPTHIMADIYAVLAKMEMKR